MSERPVTTTRSHRRRPVARHGMLRTPHPLRQLLTMIGVALGVIVVSGAGVAAYAAFDFTTSFTKDAVDLEGQDAVPPDIGAIEGGVNLLLAGTDACEPAYADIFGDRCEGPEADEELNDVNLLLHISDEPRRVTVISFPRDLMIDIPACTNADGEDTGDTYDMLNTAYVYGQLGCVVKTVSQLTGLDIQYAAKVTWGGVIEITNAIGGVEVCLASGIYDPNTGLDLEAGNHTLAGVSALQFLRTRYGVGNGGDLGRISNQQQYMSRLARKLVSEEVLSNPATLLKLARVAVDNVTPSQSLTNPMALAQIALAVKNVPFDEIVFLQYPVYEDPNDPNRVVPDYDAADALWAALAANQPLKLTGDVSQGDGVVVVEPATPGTTDPSATPTPQATETAIELPPEITGQTAAQETCSNGNLR
ncbi:LCP family protein [Microbacterium sp.]|uniref:LCP family protein n=1 Tax=Microbacterium sp. TaxID=51671 RepID=UPI0039E578DF